MTSMDLGEGTESTDNVEPVDTAIGNFETSEGDELDAAETAELEAVGIEPSDNWFDSTAPEPEIELGNVAEVDAVDDSWSGRAVDGVKGAIIGAAVTIGSLPGSALDVNLQSADPVTNSAFTTLDASHDAFSALAEKDLADGTDVRWEESTSLIVDPPSYMSNPTDFEASINDDLAASRENRDARQDRD